MAVKAKAKFNAFWICSCLVLLADVHPVRVHAIQDEWIQIWNADLSWMTGPLGRSPYCLLTTRHDTIQDHSLRLALGFTD